MENKKILHLSLQCDLPKYLPYDSYSLCRQLKEQMKCNKYKISLYLSFCLGTHFGFSYYPLINFSKSHLLNHLCRSFA